MSVGKTLQIVGVKGIPARYGGFETFAERLALYLVEKGWDVSVFCEAAEGSAVSESQWNGVRRIHVPIGRPGPLSTILYDYRCTRLAVASGGPILTLGYGTSIFNIFHLLKKRRNIMNMDGIEWRREKWGAVARAWLYLNERIALWTASLLIADHPEIARYLAPKARRPIVMIPYGADAVVDNQTALPWGLRRGHYALVIARAEPENSILDIVAGYSQRRRDMPLIVLGNYQPETNGFHAQAMAAASDEVRFVGAVYDSDIVNALRRQAALYVHGHRVGGTNPSLVEAMGARCAILAHDNRFNRWVAGEGAAYFRDAEDFDRLTDALLADAGRREYHAQQAFERFRQTFRWEIILEQYEDILSRPDIDHQQSVRS